MVRERSGTGLWGEDKILTFWENSTRHRKESVAKTDEPTPIFHRHPTHSQISVVEHDWPSHPETSTTLGEINPELVHTVGAGRVSPSVASVLAPPEVPEPHVSEVAPTPEVAPPRKERPTTEDLEAEAERKFEEAERKAEKKEAKEEAAAAAEKKKKTERKVSEAKNDLKKDVKKAANAGEEKLEQTFEQAKKEGKNLEKKTEQYAKEVKKEAKEFAHDAEKKAREFKKKAGVSPESEMVVVFVSLRSQSSLLPWTL